MERADQAAQGGAVQTILIDRVASDFLQRVAETGKPLDALAELIWNGFDAEATRVTVRFLKNDLNAIQEIQVTDNGCGISRETATEAFSQLGGSQKAVMPRDKLKRQMHGRLGRGRLRAFRIGAEVQWDSVSRDPAEKVLRRCVIKGHVTSPGRYTLEPMADLIGRERGTICRIAGIREDLPDFESLESMGNILARFAHYLEKYPGTELWIAGSRLDPAKVMIAPNIEFPIGPVKHEGRDLSATLKVVQWSVPTTSKLFLCDQRGFTLTEMPLNVPTRGFECTAHLHSAAFEDLDRTGELGLHDMNLAAHALIKPAREQLRAHLLDLEARSRRGLVEEWKQEQVYPFDGDPMSDNEAVSRDLFAIIASRVQEHTEGFESITQSSKRLSFRLLRSAIEKGPSDLLEVLEHVIDLPDEEIANLRELLTYSSLANIIKTTRTVTDRFHLLRGLDLLVNSEEGRRETLERTQLHCIIAENCWLFGEQYQLSVSDAGLTAVLRRCRTQADSEIVEPRPVVDAEGRRRRVDLVLGKTIQVGEARISNLVIELKRPSVNVNIKVFRQLEDYAKAITRDDRFNIPGVEWDFHAVSSRLDPELDDFEDAAIGLYRIGRGPRPYRIWLRTWGQVIQSCANRMQFFREHLNLQPSDEDGIALLRRLYASYVPAPFAAPPAPAAPPVA